MDRCADRLLRTSICLRVLFIIACLLVCFLFACMYVCLMVCLFYCLLACLLAQVDDGEAAHFIEAVKENHSLKELILSNNKIGEAENYNTVFPDYQTGLVLYKVIVLSCLYCLLVLLVLSGLFCHVLRVACMCSICVNI